MDPVYFRNTESLRDWFEKNHDKEKELLVGYFKKATGEASITWSESVDEALCFGWIDGIRKSIDAERYTIRFTPRKPDSNWSDVNLKKMEELIRTGRMCDAGLKIYLNRKPERERTYSYESRDSAVLTEKMEALFRQNPDAWNYFQAQAASYRKTTIRWVRSARQESTQFRRLEELITASTTGEYIKSMRWGRKDG